MTPHSIDSPKQVCNHQIVLASSSPRRKELMKKLCTHFVCEASTLQEPPYTQNEYVSPHEYAVSLAQEKALDVFLKRKSGPESAYTVLGMDTIVIIENEVLGKPKTKQEAFQMIQKLQGRWHQVITGYAIISQSLNSQILKRVGFEKTDVHFPPMQTQDIYDFIEKEAWADKAGGYGIQSQAAVIVDQIQGCFYNIMGFPLATIYKIIKKDLQLV